MDEVKACKAFVLSFQAFASGQAEEKKSWPSWKLISCIRQPWPLSLPVCPAVGPSNPYSPNSPHTE